MARVVAIIIIMIRNYACIHCKYEMLVYGFFLFLFMFIVLLNPRSSFCAASQSSNFGHFEPVLHEG